MDWTLYAQALLGIVVFTASNDLDVFVLEDECTPGSCVDYDGNTAQFIAEAGKTYYFVLDGNSGAQGSYTITVSCN